MADLTTQGLSIDLAPYVSKGRERKMNIQTTLVIIAIIAAIGIVTIVVEPPLMTQAFASLPPQSHGFGHGQAGEHGNGGCGRPCNI